MTKLPCKKLKAGQHYWTWLMGDSPHHISAQVNTDHIRAFGTEFNINYMNLLPKGDCAEIELSVEKSHTSAFIYLKPQYQPVVSVKYGTRGSLKTSIFCAERSGSCHL